MKTRVSRLLSYCCLIALFFGNCVCAIELTGENVLVLYKKGDKQSNLIAEYYADKRDVPASQVFGVDIKGNAAKIEPDDFIKLKDKLKPHFKDNIKVILMTWHAPYKVGCMSITSAMTLGYDEDYCNQNSKRTAGCHRTANSPLFNTKDDELWKNNDTRLSMLLSGKILFDAKRLINRGVKSDGTFPKGQGFLVRTQDKARSSRWPLFQAMAEAWTNHEQMKLHYVDDRALPPGKTSVSHKKNVMFYFTGYVKVPDFKTNQYLPGAVADHLTSFGGQGIGSNGQMKAYRWLEAGVTGSYGAVDEPCSFPEKFPNPLLLIANYMSGNTLIEAYWKSVQQPGEGIFVGEPLASPWRKN